MTNVRLVVTADDFGLSPEVDDGIADLAREGRVSAVSAMVNPPCAPDFARLGAVAPGLHLDLLHGRPVSEPAAVPSLVDARGAFRNDPAAQLAALSADDVACEWRAQLAAFRARAGREPAHLDVHKHLHARDGRLFAIALDLARPLGIPVRSLDDGMRARCRAAGVPTADHFVGGVAPAPYWTAERLAAALRSLQPGVTELMCHPGRGVTALPGLFYARERDVERDAFLCPEIGELLAQAPLVGFRDALRLRGNGP